LILSEKHFKDVSATTTMASLIAPLERIFAPVFFVLMGMQVNLQSFLAPTTLWLALAFSVAAVIGKLVCGLPAGGGTDRWSIGLGMIPRGEVGLIFASIGKGLGVVSGSVFSALVVMVVVTTLITPIFLKWSLFRAPGVKGIT
jgi:Kef-type K+ transport system membrane component KefB